MSNLRSFFCPACGAKLKVKASHQSTRYNRDQYAGCSNAICGATYLVRSEIVKLISPPSRYFRDNLPNYDLFEADEHLLECAVDFVRERFLHVKNENDLLKDCVAYLQILSNNTKKELPILAAHAIAIVDSRCCSDWQIVVNNCSRYALVVRDGYGQKHVLSLREVVQCLAAREAKYHHNIKEDDDDEGDDYDF